MTRLLRDSSATRCNWRKSDRTRSTPRWMCGLPRRSPNWLPNAGGVRPAAPAGRSGAVRERLRRRILSDQAEVDVDDLGTLTGRRLLLAIGALAADKLEAAPQLDVALLHLVAQFAAFEFRQRRLCKMTPRTVQPLFQIEDGAVQSFKVDHRRAGWPFALI